MAATERVDLVKSLHNWQNILLQVSDRFTVAQQRISLEK